ncbi:helix-turn-helix domain-containing protein [Paenibacillus macerans]|uniref:helix-turn-helix domain-containing protein n=1 Tax=Paenibacillus macerans TaxID=44252 RepID=UPI00203ABE0F|nr:helix-turn-helix domain-containing protein [Paenibacillus macerans]MCM3702393.1 helix-turn-helix domain-containing protein [Paenibacillus macerans]
MEAQGVRDSERATGHFIETVKKAQSGDMDSMEDILTLFSGDIEYLAKFIMLPKEEAIQTLKIELINIVYHFLSK